MVNTDTPESSDVQMEHENSNPDPSSSEQVGSGNSVENNSDIELTEEEKHLQVLNVKTKMLRSQMLLFEASKKCAERNADEDIGDLPSSLKDMEKRHSMFILKEHLWKMAMHSSIICMQIQKQNNPNEHGPHTKKIYSVLERLNVLHYTFDALIKEYSEKMEQVYQKKIELARQLSDYNKMLNEQKYRMEEDEADEDPEKARKFAQLLLRLEKINTIRRLQILLLGVGDVDLVNNPQLMKYFKNKRQTVTLKNIMSL